MEKGGGGTELWDTHYFKISLFTEVNYNNFYRGQHRYTQSGIECKYTKQYMYCSRRPCCR